LIRGRAAGSWAIVWNLPRNCRQTGCSCRRALRPGGAGTVAGNSPTICAALEVILIKRDQGGSRWAGARSCRCGEAASRAQGTSAAIVRWRYAPEILCAGGQWRHGVRGAGNGSTAYDIGERGISSHLYEIGSHARTSASGPGQGWINFDADRGIVWAQLRRCCWIGGRNANG
jgi:hypothetical protein